MATQKFLAIVANKIRSVVASVTGTVDAIPAGDATGRLDISWMPVGVGAEVSVLPTSENLTAGDFVNIYDNAGTVTVRKADATTTSKPADGFVLANVTSPANATVYHISNKNTQLSGLTKGVDYFLSTTPGVITATAPLASGNLWQRLGKAESTTALVFNTAEYIEIT